MTLKEKKSKDVDYIFGSAWVYKTAKADWVKIIPPEIGDLKYSVRSDNHAGWLLCNGSEVSKIEYLDLFNVINNNFDVDGTSGSTFNLPDARGRVLGSIGTGTGLSPRTLGQRVGAETHALTIPEMPAHTHSVELIPTGTQTVATDDGTAGTAANEGTTTVTSGSTGGTTGNATVAHNNMQPTLFIGNTFIFAKHQTDSVPA